MSDNDNYCEEHELSYPDGYDRCPVCVEEERARVMEVERAVRNQPKSVDDPAPIESYRR